jgi:hypothetical protein
MIINPQRVSPTFPFIMQNLLQSALRLKLSLAAMLFVAIVAVSVPVRAEDKPATEQKYTAMLIWGTDAPKPNDPNLKDVDPKLIEKFRKIFKWKDYYEIKRQDIDLKMGQPQDVALSDKCAIKLNLTEKEGMAYELLGEGKSVYKGNQSMPLKDILILAGDDKNATAWFVVLKPR